jgi:hypothetical protein
VTAAHASAVPPGPTVDFDVHIGLHAVTITWTGDGPAAALALRPRGTTEVIEVPATAGPDGRFAVELDPTRLRIRPPVRLDLSVRSGDGPWIPLRRPRAEYPPLGRIVTFSSFPVTVAGLPPLTAQVYYTQDNRLAIRIETALRSAR